MYLLKLKDKLTDVMHILVGLILGKMFVFILSIFSIMSWDYLDFVDVCICLIFLVLLTLINLYITVFKT